MTYLENDIIKSCGQFKIYLAGVTETRLNYYLTVAARPGAFIFPPQDLHSGRRRVLRGRRDASAASVCRQADGGTRARCRTHPGWQHEKAGLLESRRLQQWGLFGLATEQAMQTAGLHRNWLPCLFRLHGAGSSPAFCDK